jgi:protein tyrosine phosphatase
MDYPVIEGPGHGRDISHNIFFSECEDLQEIEKGIPVSEYIEEIHKRNLDLEFRLMRKLTQTKKHMDYLIPNSPFLQGFNRYSDVLPYSDTIVKVSSGEYINGNWVSGPTQNNFFIATQGPLQSTRNSFWKIVWEYNIKLIIMISAIKEGGKVKCDQYFPLEDCLNTEDFTVSIRSTKNEYSTLIDREFEITDGQETKEVRHLQSIAWPDHGTPDLDEEFESIKFLIDFIRSSSPPVLVHCSAGVGRTGTLITLYHLISVMDILKKNARISVFGTVRRLREQRWGMVQTKDQYEFIYKFMELWINKFFN